MASKYTAMTGLSGVVGTTKSANAYERWKERNPLSIAGYFVPGVGSAMMAGDAMGNFGRGQWLRGIGNLGIAAGMLIPGAGALAGLAKGTRGFKALRQASAATKAMRLAKHPGAWGAGYRGLSHVRHAVLNPITSAWGGTLQKGVNLTRAQPIVDTLARGADSLNKMKGMQNLHRYGGTVGLGLMVTDTAGLTHDGDRPIPQQVARNTAGGYSALANAQYNRNPAPATYNRRA